MGLLPLYFFNHHEADIIRRFSKIEEVLLQVKINFPGAAVFNPFEGLRQSPGEIKNFPVVPVFGEPVRIEQEDIPCPHQIDFVDGVFSFVAQPAKITFAVHIFPGGQGADGRETEHPLKTDFDQFVVLRRKHDRQGKKNLAVP